jgi:2-methylisocitrate lyase-like PEP mutase family enzyme
MSERRFHELHAEGRLLVLPNAWDAASARLVESCGAEAIATTSAGLAWAHGYPDGNALPTRVLVGAVKEIARVLQVPLSVDVEAGYADDPSAVVELARAVADAGAAGINIEDGSGAPEALARKIEAIKGARADLFVNARTDVYLRGLAAGDAAGCDGVFVPCAKDREAIAALARAIAPLPLNLMAIPGLPAAAELRALGVRRLSAGASIAASALATVRDLATRFLADGASFAPDIDYGAVNRLFAR